MRSVLLMAAAAALAGCSSSAKEPARGPGTGPPTAAPAASVTAAPAAPTIVVARAPEVHSWRAGDNPVQPTLSGPVVSPIHSHSARAAAVTNQHLGRWRFVVLSDIHVFSNARIPKDALEVVKQVAQMKPRLVIITGDSTNGNKGDRFSVRSIGRWWSSVHALLQPLYDAKIPVLSVAGNHDTYRVRHRDGYAKAWADQSKRAAPLTLSFGKTPFYYSVDVGDTHLVLLDIVTQHIDKKQQAWLEQDLAASKAKLKLVFGHVPIASAITRPVRSFRNKMTPLLAKHGVNAYIAGHEHLIWDDMVRVGNSQVRQVICGTSSGTYNYGIRPSLIKRHCKDGLCQWPLNGHRFRAKKKSREMWRKTTAMVIDVVRGQTEIEVHPHYLAKDGTLTEFPRAPTADAP